MNFEKAAGWCFACAVAAACACESWRLPALAFGADDGSRPVLATRRAVERFVPRGERVTLLRVDRADNPSQVCRQIFLSVAWAAGAGNVEEKRELDGNERYVVTAPFPAALSSLAGNPRYREHSDSESGRVWIRDDAPFAVTANDDGEGLRHIRGAGIAAVARECGDWREALGLVVPALLALAMLAAGLGRMPSRTALLAAAAVFLPSAMFALSHTFAGPCGTGVFGGRARAFVESGCSLATLADPKMGEYFQAAYPPLQTLVTAAGYIVAGSCGDWLTQLAPCLFAAAAAVFLASRTTGIARLWLALLFLTPVALMTTGQFYPEPLMALGVLVGWERVRDGQFGGWLLLGAAGWFKNEGLMFLFAAWLAWRIVAGADHARLRDLAAAMVLPLAWHVGCRLAGASLNDYVAPWRLSPLRGLRALLESLRLAFARSWHYGFAYPAALVAILIPSIRRKARPLLAALLFTAFSVAFFCLAYACSTADEAWHLSTSLPRLLWMPALILAREVAAICKRNGNGL